MIRYLSSFLITSILYSIFIGLFLFSFANQKVIEPKKIQKKKVSLKHIVLIKKEEEKTKILKKQIIEPVEKVVKEEIIIEKPLPKVKKLAKIEKPKKKKIKKIVKKKKKKSKKIVKKLIKKKPVKKVVKKKIEKKKELAKDIVKKVTTPPIINTPIVKHKVVNIAPIVNYKDNFLKKNLLIIKKQIQKHIKYSKRARKMHIQGNVIVQFELLKDGTIKNIKALSGHRMLRRSTIKAIKKAASIFPRVQKSITIKVPIKYKLNKLI